MGKIFLSYSHEDAEFVRELHRRLTRDGVDCFFDTVSIGWGDTWVKALERAAGPTSNAPARSRTIPPDSSEKPARSCCASAATCPPSRRFSNLSN